MKIISIWIFGYRISNLKVWKLVEEPKTLKFEVINVCWNAGRIKNTQTADN